MDNSNPTLCVLPKSRLFRYRHSGLTKETKTICQRCLDRSLDRRERDLLLDRRRWPRSLEEIDDDDDTEEDRRRCFDFFPLLRSGLFPRSLDLFLRFDLLFLERDRDLDRLLSLRICTIGLRDLDFLRDDDRSIASFFSSAFASFISLPPLDEFTLTGGSAPLSGKRGFSIN